MKTIVQISIVMFIVGGIGGMVFPYPSQLESYSHTLFALGMGTVLLAMFLKMFNALFKLESK